MRIGYARISKADSSQVLDLQRDALIAARVKRTTSTKTGHRAKTTTALPSPPA
jgi:hypothetical protein